MENNKVEKNNTNTNNRPVVSLTADKRPAVKRPVNSRAVSGTAAKKGAANKKADKKISDKQKTVIISVLIACALVITGIIAGFALGSSSVKYDNPDDAQTNLSSEKEELSIMSVTEDGDWVTVKTSYITLRYPFAFSDIIEVEAFNENSASQLRFYSEMDGKKILNYVIHFNDNEGTPCGTLDLKKEIPVSAEFKAPPKKLSKDWYSTFYAVQETFNDVLKSMSEDKAFCVVE